MAYGSYCWLPKDFFYFVCYYKCYVTGVFVLIIITLSILAVAYCCIPVKLITIRFSLRTTQMFSKMIENWDF